MTTMANEVQTPDDTMLVVKRLLNATPELAFRAWTLPEHIQQWMQPEQGMVVQSASMDLKVGGRFRIQMQKPDGEYFTAAGVFQEVKEPERLVYTWDWEKDGSGTEFGELEGQPTLVRVEFLNRGEQTELVLTHSQFATAARRDNHARGWDTLVESFADFVEA